MGFVVVIVFLTISLLLVAFLLMKANRLIAELSKQAIKLQESNTVKDRLFSIIGHDLIGSIGNMPEALWLCRNEKTTPEDRDMFLSLLEKSAIASYETLQNLLNWGESQIQGIIIKQEDINAHDIAVEVLHLINIAAENKQITIKNNIANGIMIHADPHHFRFIIRNLLSNAVKYSRNNGCVEVNATISQDLAHCVFSVKDDGMGLGDDKKAEIFESFGISTPGTANEIGHGIGLRLCKEFVVENGGRIWVESETNKGATFSFFLKTA